jgi:hypothetical protein
VPARLPFDGRLSRRRALHADVERFLVIVVFFVATAERATQALAGCATMRVGSFVERGTNFTVYRTYAWASDAQLSTGDPRLDNNEFFQTRLRAAVEKGLGVDESVARILRTFPVRTGL